MDKLRKLIVMLLVAMVAITSLSASSSGERSQAAEAAAQELYNLGLFSGTGTDSNGNPIFELERAPNRHEAVTMLVRLLGKEDEAKSKTWSTPFTDVAEWATPYVGYAYTNGLTNGISANAYGGNQNISATQYLTFVLRTLGYQSGTDFDWARAWEISDKIGLTHGEYNGRGQFTRGDVAIISLNALSTKLKGQDVTLYDAYHSQVDQNRNTTLTSPETGFEVHYIDVGEADSALIVCDGHAMLVDGGNVGDSSLIYTYLKNRGIDYLDYVICTHAHEDHVGGLSGALNYATAGKVYCPVTEYGSRAFENFVKYVTKQGLSITVPTLGETFTLGSATAQIIGPVRATDNVNNTSIVFRIQYGETSFLFTGDAEREEEQEIISAGYELKSTVLKVGHHGSSSSTSYPFLYYTEPLYAVISVGADNQYGHPTDDTLSKLRDADVTVYRTDKLGTVICRSDGKTVSFLTEEGTAATPASLDNTVRVIPSLPETTNNPISRDTPSSGIGNYVLNTNSHRFHYPDCSSVSRMSEKNKQVFEGTRDEIIAMGYTPCGQCNP